MSTHSLIGVQHQDGTVSYVYCHWDGHTETNGRTLHEHYQDRAKVLELITLGNLSDFRENLFPDPSRPHSMGSNDERQDGVCVFHYRDGGRDWESSAPGKARNCEEFFAYRHQCRAEYCYLLTTEFGWFVKEGSDPPRPLAKALADLTAA